MVDSDSEGLVDIQGLYFLDPRGKVVQELPQLLYEKGFTEEARKAAIRFKILKLSRKMRKMKGKTLSRKLRKWKLNKLSD